MSNILTGIKNFLQLIYENWFLIIAILSLCYGIYKKISIFFDKSTEERIAIAKIQIQQGILKMISDSEKSYETWVKAGEIKRSQVIKQIYSEYPILEKVQNQDELIEWMDEQIKDALKTLRKVVAETKEAETKDEN